MKILNKSRNRDFTVLNLSDPQLSIPEWDIEHKNRKIIEQTVNELMERVKPDLVTISGDLSWAGQFDAYRMLGKYIDSFGVPWAVVWGNHDNQDGADFVERVVSEYEAYPNFVYERGCTSLGNGNYVISIIEEDGVPVEAIFMMDSHNTDPFTNSAGEVFQTWSRLTEEQIEWFNKNVNELKASGCKDATIILHIPIYAYNKAADAAYDSSVDRKQITPEQSSNGVGWNDGYTDSIGVQYEGIGSYPVEDGVFDAVKVSGITKHIIAGHDHVNNWMISQLYICIEDGRRLLLDTGAERRHCFENKQQRRL